MQDIAFLAARVMLSVIFILSGFGKLMAVAGVAGMLQKAGMPQPQMMGYAVGILELVAGILVLVGFFTRWAALALAASAIATIFFLGLRRAAIYGPEDPGAQKSCDGRWSSAVDIRRPWFAFG